MSKQYWDPHTYEIWIHDWFNSGNDVTKDEKNGIVMKNHPGLGYVEMNVPVDNAKGHDSLNWYYNSYEFYKVVGHPDNTVFTGEKEVHYPFRR